MNGYERMHEVHPVMARADSLESAAGFTDAQLRREIEVTAQRVSRGWSGVPDTRYLAVLIAEQHSRQS